MTSSLELLNPGVTPTSVVAGGLSLLDYGAKADAQKFVDGAIGAAGATALQLPTATLTNADVGKPIAVEACGSGLTQMAKMTSGSNTLTLTWLIIKVTASGGTWDYTHTALGTAAGLAWNITAPALVTALEALYGAGKVTVSLSGTTYTITLLSGAASTDTTQITTSAAGLTTTVNGPVVSALVTYQVWNYADVGKRVQVPGAGPAGGVLTAWIGSVEPTTSNIAYLYDTAPVPAYYGTIPIGNPVNASATLVGSYYTLNWLRTTIASVTDATHLVLAAPVDAGVQVALTGLEVHYGTDNTTALSNAITAARAQQKPLSLGAGAYLCTAGQSSSSTNGLTIYGAGQDATIFRCIPTDAEAESARFEIKGLSDTYTGRATGVSVRNFTWNVPTAHTRGAGTLAGVPNNKVNAGGLYLFGVTYFSIFDVRVDNNYGVAFNLQNVSHGLVTFCRATNSWADSFNVNNSNSSGPATTPGCNDVTFYGCTAQNSGDDMFTTNQYNAQGPRHTAISFIDCHGIYQRQLALGRGVAIVGGDNITVGDCTMVGNNSAGFDVTASNAKNAINTVTVATPSTGAVLTFAAAPANVTAGTTQMRVFKNDGSGTYWIGDVTTIGGAGTVITLAATTGYATTCPFTGVNSLVQWGANNDGFRWGLGGSKHVVISNCMSDSANQNPAGDGTLNASIRVNGGQASASLVTDVTIDNVALFNCYQSGLLINSQTTTLTQDVTSDRTITEINVDNLTVSTTGLSTLTSTRPWPGVYVRLGRNISIRGKLRDTADDAILIASSGVSGEIRLDLIGEDIARIPQAGVPQATAFTLGSSSNYSAVIERLHLTNPAGTSGGTKYVCTTVVSQPSTGSSIRNVSSDIAGQALLTETASRYSIVISPVMFRGKGSPETVVTAPVGAMYERSDGAAGTVLYMKESGTGNTGWIAYSGPSGAPAPELDVIYGSNLEMTAAAGVLVAGSVYFVRLKGAGTIANILAFPIASLTGNAQAGIYLNSSSGFNATPTGSPIQQTGSVAVAAGAGGSGPGMVANTRNPMALAASMSVIHLGHWFGFQVDSATTTWERIASLGNLGLGFCRSQTGAYVAGTMPAASSPGAAGSTWPVLLGT